ncbi:MAG: hypothetical protein Fur0041_02510 [Bacteroidia bacterium]
MKQLFRKILTAAVILSVSIAAAQSPTVCPINAGPDQTICAPNCATLTGTFVPTNQTTSYTTSQIPYTPDPFTTGTAISLFDDQWSQVIPLPFPFCFYGQVYNSCLIGANGLISFTLTGAGGYCQWPINAPVPTTADPMNTIMGPWQDLNPSLGGQIRYATYGVAPCRRFVVSWYQVPMYSCGTPATQQIILYETTNIIDNFIQTKVICGWNGGRAIQAIHNNNGTQAVVQAGRNSPLQWTANNEGRRYTPSGANTYSIAWYQGVTLIGNTATISVCPTQTTTYTFQATYTNCNNQTVTVSDQVIVNSSSLTVSANPSNVNICTGGNTQLSASATGAISWSWSPAQGLSATNISNPVASPTVTTVYTVTATDASGCSGTAQVTVNVTPMTTADAGLNDTVCSGSCINLNASGGVSYQWAADPSFSGPTNVANPQVCPTVTTTYTVTVTDANGCTGTDNVTIYVAPQPLAVSITGTDNTCFNACNGSATSNATGGYAPYTYSWSNSSTSTSVSGLCAGTYNLTVTDLIGCTATASVTITEPTAVVIQSTNIQTANCGQNDGAVTISVSGGTGSYTILWPASGNSGLTESNLPPGQVCVYAYDANGCGDTLCVNVPNTPGATVNIVSTINNPCFNSCEGILVADATGGTGPYNFVWMPGNINNDTAMMLCAGTYTVTMTDVNGCQDTISATITQPTQVTVTPGAASTICIGQTATISATGNGGTPSYTYDWTDGTNVYSGQSVSVSPVVTTTYTVTVTDANGCVSSTATVTVTVNPPLQVQAGPAQIVCQGTLVTLTANGSGGDGNLTYTWLPINQTGNMVATTVNATTTYTVIVSDGCGTPVAIDSTTVTINPAPIVNITATSDVAGCEDLCVAFTNNTPNTATINWVFGNNLGTSTSANPTFCFTDAGQYNIQATVVDNIGCIGTVTLPNYVTVYPLPVADFTASPQPATLLNNTVTFTDMSTGAVSWIWSFGQDDSASTIQNPEYAFQDTGVFNVQLIVTNQYGCQDDVTLPIVVQEDYAIFIPNAFTPNGDGLNETFFPQGIGVNPDKFTMYIFDRWGNMIYKTTTWPGGWDGTVQGTGKLCQIDTYVYKISTVDPNGSRRQYIGHVNLIR